MLKANSRNAMFIAVIFLAAVSASSLYAATAQQRTFATPQEAMQATIDASKHNDTAALRQIFGPASKDVIESGDPAQDKQDRAEFVGLAQEKLGVVQDPTNPDRVTFTIGDEEWPFPVPLIRVDGKWKFDTGSGRMEILAHRIGENELTAIDMCHAFVQAEHQYAGTPHDGAGVQEYAQKLLSSPGKHDGLYSDDSGTDIISKPFAEAVASGKPYHGYYFRVLTAEGPSAPGGALNYMVDGRLIGGFALLAWPAEYEVSGVKTFIVNDDGIVYEKDLGAHTAVAAAKITSFDPDSS